MWARSYPASPASSAGRWRIWAAATGYRWNTRGACAHRRPVVHGAAPAASPAAAAGKLLEAAAHLLDVGHYISSSSHHKHSYYVVANSDMPGFTERERVLVAALCRYHRKALPNPVHTAFNPWRRRKSAH